MKEVEDFIFAKEGGQRDLLLFLHNLLVEEYQLVSKIRYKIPFYDKNSWLFYLSPLKNGAVDFAVIRASELTEAKELLDFKKRKQVASLELNPNEDLPENEIRAVIKAALSLDEKSPYKGPRKK